MQSPPTIVMCTMHNSMHLSTNDLLNISSSLVPSPLSLYADQPTTQTRISNFYVQTYSINHSWPTKFDMATADAYESHPYRTSGFIRITKPKLNFVKSPISGAPSTSPEKGKSILS